MKMPQLKTRKVWMEKLTSKGKHKVKVGYHPHTNIISTSNHKKTRVKMQDIGNAFEIKRPSS